MRAGGFTIHQALTPEAATIIKQAVTLAKRRGHAQVTPLHVAHTMLLASPAGPLRTACLQSHSHPLQCKALELCFNVALNRLPASSTSSSSTLGTQNHNHGISSCCYSSSQHPSISNALVAAFKRAQAHQRRGSIESQQQPLLAVKIELQQLIISILDDPSVSRVMREAGFSSTQVKSNIEHAQAQVQAQALPPQSISITTRTSITSTKSKDVDNEDVIRVVKNLMQKKKKNLVIVGESLDIIQGVVREVMNNEGLRDVKVIKIPLSSIGHLTRCERERKLGELKCLVKGNLAEKKVVFYVGDLEWVIQNRAAGGGGSQGKSSNYTRDDPVEEMIDEIGKLANYGRKEEKERILLLGFASFETYMKCRNGCPSLQTLWDLHAITVPAASSLSLSLITESDVQSETQREKARNASSWVFNECFGSDKQDKQVSCCIDCSENCKREARTRRSTSTLINGDPSSSTLPLWLKDENKRLNASNNTDQDCVSVKELSRNWNSFCSSTHKQTLSFTSLSLHSSTSCFLYDRQNPNLNQATPNWPGFEPKNSYRDRNLWSSLPIDKACEISLGMYHSTLENTCSTPNSASSGDIMEAEYIQRFKEFNMGNLKTLCIALEKVSWHKDIIPDIASTVLQCRSGMVRRREKINSSNENNVHAKEETWFLFKGVDGHAKEKIGMELGKVLFGSHSSFVSLPSNTFSLTKSNSTEDLLRNKRVRDDSLIERLGDELLVNPHRVFLVEDVEQVDHCTQMGIKRAIEKGKIVKPNGEEISLSDAIVILSCGSSYRSPVKDKSNEDELKECELKIMETSNSVSLDLNMCINDGGNEEEDQSINHHDIGLVQYVDRCIIFKLQEL